MTKAAFLKELDALRDRCGGSFTDAEAYDRFLTGLGDIFDQHFRIPALLSPDEIESLNEKVRCGLAYYTISWTMPDHVNLTPSETAFLLALMNTQRESKNNDSTCG